MHDFTKVVRRAGNRVRKQCVCTKVGPWEVALPENNPMVLNTLSISALRKKARERGIPHYTTMSKTEIIEALTEVRAVGEVG